MHNFLVAYILLDVLEVKQDQGFKSLSIGHADSWPADRLHPT